MKHLSEDQIQILIEGGTDIDQGWIAHLQACDKCRHEVESLTNLHKVLQNLEYHQPSMRFAKNIMDIFEKSNVINRKSIFWTRFTSRAILASIALSCIMVIYMSFFDVDQLFILQSSEKWLDPLLQWNVILLLTVVAFWILYYFDRWLGSKSRI